MTSHGAHSMLGIISDADARCYALGNPGDPTVPPEAQRFSLFCPTTANGSNASSDPYASWKYTSLNHTLGLIKLSPMNSTTHYDTRLSSIRC